MTDLQIIGAGFGRTGTESMRRALEMLGFGPCHHNFVLAEDADHKQRWIDALDSGDMDWNQLLKGFRSCVDWPTAFFWPELSRQFPKAKVVLTWRPPENWWRSYAKTILPSVQRSVGTDDIGPAGQLVVSKVFGGRYDDAAHCIAAYKANVEKVKQDIAPDRLLIHQLGDDWEPLCDFLNVPVPSEPYPRSNSTQEFKDRPTRGVVQ